ncbi:MAG: GAF domain-containing protein [Chloroflexota bacterium]
MAEPDSKSSTTAALQALQAAAQRAAVARRLQGDAGTTLLQGVVDVAATILDAQAASIALFERDPDRLEYRVAAGPQGAGVVGLSVPPARGIVGFVFSTGQPIAVSDVRKDPRFDKGTAERTGYVPFAIAAAPISGAGGTIGVLQVLDKRDGETFSLRDMDLLARLARQAAASVEATRVQRDASLLLREVLRATGEGELDDADLDELVGAAATALDRDAEHPFWRLVDLVSRVRGMSDRELTLVVEMLEVVARTAGRSVRQPGRRRRLPVDDDE